MATSISGALMARHLAAGSLIMLLVSQADSRASVYGHLDDIKRASAPRETAIAQGGSTGGTLGKQRKSVSGGEEAPSARRTKKSERTRERRAAVSRDRGSTRASYSYDGSWSGVSTGSCINRFSWTVQITNGVLSGGNTVGHVSRGGVVNGIMTVVGKPYRFVGRGRRDQFAGTWTAPGPCSGRWIATRNL